MSIEVLPLGMTCRRACDYCYQEPVRDAGNEADGHYDMAAMQQALTEEGYKFTVFGGEPLLMPIEDLEALFAFGKRQFGDQATADGRRANGIQTDGYLITDEHLRMFRRYDVGVGISCDGPGELNDARSMRHGGLEATRAATAKTEAALEKMLRAGMPTSLIVTLHALNASPERLPRLMAWLRDLHAIGLRNVNLHLLERDSAAADELALADGDTVEALMAAAALMDEIGLHVEPVADMRQLLRGQDRNEAGHTTTSCIWNGCDPYTTDAVRGVGGHGERLNCGRTYKDGVQMQKAPAAGFERYLALYHTPQIYGGCAGCRFFFACKGNCPGTSVGGDWRAKTEHCGVLAEVFSRLEGAMLAAGERPFSLDPRRGKVEEMMIAQWAAGSRPSVSATVDAYGHGQVLAGAGDQDHLDVPHGDQHEDHDDAERAS